MFAPGFLGTRAPFYMDFVTLIVALLPLLVAVAISFARRGEVVIHKVVQLVIFVVSVIIVGYFEYGVRINGGFDVFVRESGMPRDFVFAFLLLHILIAVLTLAWWVRAIKSGFDALRLESITERRGKHRQLGKQAAVGIFLTSLSGIGVYLFLFVF